MTTAEARTAQQGSGEPRTRIEVVASAEGTARQLIDLLSDNDVFPDVQINKMMGKLEQFLKTYPWIFAVAVSPAPSLEYPRYEPKFFDDDDRERTQHTLVLPQRFGVLLMKPEEDIKDKYHLVLEFVRAASLTRTQGTGEVHTNSRLEAFQEVIEKNFNVFEELMDSLLGIDEGENLEIRAPSPEENKPRQLSFFENFSVK